MEKSSRPVVANGTAKDLGGSPSNKRTTLIGSAVENQLDRTLWQLMSGDVGFEHLTPALLAWWTVAFEAGRASLVPELRQSQHEADRLWLLAFGEVDRREYLLDRLDRAVQLAERPDVDDVLDEAWRIYCASLDRVRSPIDGDDGGGSI